MKRKSFLKITSAGVLGLLVPRHGQSRTYPTNYKKEINKPVVISTWNHGYAANKVAWEKLMDGGSALDAVESGVRVSESDPQVNSVGLGGLPDSEGRVTLDACIMNHLDQCGAVAYLQHIENPISVARRVMENTPHVMLVGDGAQQFAYDQGFPKTNLLTPESKERWKQWKKSQSDKLSFVNHNNHDTIGMLALDEEGNVSGACTTSGLAFKMPGRVGDSPIIGAGLFVDNEVGAACATGMGEAVIRIVGSHTVVELMRQGYLPQDACKEVIDRLIRKHKNMEGIQVGFIAINKQGHVGAYSVYDGFDYAYHDKESEKMIPSPFVLNS